MFSGFISGKWPDFCLEAKKHGKTRPVSMVLRSAYLENIRPLLITARHLPVSSVAAKGVLADFE